MTLERLTALLEAYGSDPRRWPEAERAAAEALIVRSAHAQELHAKAQALDNFLDAAPPLPVRDDLRRRILTQVDARGIEDIRTSSLADWFFGHWWPQAAALAVAAILGIFIGARVLPPQADRTAENEVAEWVFASDVTEGVDR